MQYLGKERLLESAQACLEKTVAQGVAAQGAIAHDLQEGLLAQARAFAESAPQLDDITLMVLVGEAGPEEV